MSNSPLVNHTQWSPNHSGLRKGKISKITIHHTAGVLSVETLGNIFAPTSRKASSTYGVGFDGRIGQYVDEANHPWTSGNWANDDIAVTIEVSNSQTGGIWPVSDNVLEKTIQLCVDICRRNNIAKLNFTGNATGNLTLHKYFQSTACPGPYLEAKMPYIASEVNRRLAPPTPVVKPPTVLYRVQLGAFGVLSNAQRLASVLKSKGFDVIVIKVGSLYKVQVGAFGVASNASNMLSKVKSAGYKDAFITTQSGSYVAPTPAPTPAPVQTVKAGSLVRVKNNARDWYGKTFASFVYQTPYLVSELNTSTGRAVITSNGVVVGAIHVSNLYLI